MSFKPLFSVKETQGFRLMMLFSQNESFWTIKMSFHYGRKIGVFPNGLTDDSGQKFQISFKPTFL